MSKEEFDMEDYEMEKSIYEMGFEVFDTISDLVQYNKLESWIKSLEEKDVEYLHKLLDKDE
jgi:hypothetical protein